MVECNFRTERAADHAALVNVLMRSIRHCLNIENRNMNITNLRAAAAVLALAWAPALPAATTNSIAVANFASVDFDSALQPTPVGWGSPVVVSNKLYYDWAFSGDIGQGCLFSLNLAAGATNILVDFNTHTNPDEYYPAGGLSTYGSCLYGACADGGIGYGFTFKYDLANGEYSHVAIFGGTNGMAPLAPPITRDGVLFYGTTSADLIYTPGGNSSGVVYCYSNGVPGSFLWVRTLSITNALPPQYRFANGIFPVYRLTFGPNGDFDHVYGTTMFGSTNNRGTIFQATCSSGNISLIHTFPSASGLTTGAYEGVVTRPNDPYLYGSIVTSNGPTYGTIYRIKPDGTDYQALYDKLSPPTICFSTPTFGPDGAIYVAGYDLTDAVGAGIYRLDPDDTSGALTELASFPTVTDYGSTPVDCVFGPDGKLYWLSQSSPRTAYRITIPMPTRIVSMAGSAAGTHLGFTAIAGFTYTVQSTTNLAGGWTDVATVAATNSPTQVLDTNKYDSSFYRVSQTVDTNYAAVLGAAQMKCSWRGDFVPYDYSSYPVIIFSGCTKCSVSTNGLLP